MWRYLDRTGDTTAAVLHVTALTAAIAALALRDRVPRQLRDWLPLALGPFLYIELRWLIAGLGGPHHDATVIGWEHALLRGDPSATWAVRHPSLALSELLHLCYASYYLLVLLPPVALAATRRRVDFARTVLTLSIVYALCFGAYLAWPVDGPRYLVGPAPAPDGPVRSLVLSILAAGSSRGTAFPSSHVAASVVASLCVLRVRRGWGTLVAALTAGLTLGTVYGGFHYGVDALAGLATGLVSWQLSGLAWRALSRGQTSPAPGAQSATAAW